MTNLNTNIDLLLNNLNNNYNNNITTYNTIYNNTNPNRFLLKSGDSMNGILNVSNIDSNTNLNIGSNSSSINFGINKTNKIINIGGLNDSINLNAKLNNLNINNSFNINNHKIKNLSTAINDNDAINLQQTNSIISNAINNIAVPKAISSFNNPITSNININNNKIINVNNAQTYTDAINLNQANTLLSNSINNFNLSNLTTTSNNLNVLLGNTTFGKITDNQITDNTINSSKLTNYPNNNNLLLIGNSTYNKINNDFLNDNSINPSKILNYPNDPNKFLTGDGSFKIASTGITQTNISSNNYSGSLNNIICKILIVANTTSTLTTLKTNLDKLVSSLNGSSKSIIINVFNYSSNTDILSYDSSYDVILFWNELTIGTNTISILNQYYNAGKGVILGIYNSNSNLNLDKNITSTINYNSTNNNSFNQTSSHILFNGITSIIPYYCSSNFTPINNSINLGNNNNFNLLNYLDDFTSKGRRIDLNLYPFNVLQNDTSLTGGSRLILQCLLWCARRIDKFSYSLTFDPNNMQYVSNTNMNNYKIINVANCSDNYDIVNKNYIDTTICNSINNYIKDNTIDIKKFNFTGDGTLVLYDDGTFKSPTLINYVFPNDYNLSSSEPTNLGATLQIFYANNTFTFSSIKQLTNFDATNSWSYYITISTNANLLNFSNITFLGTQNSISYTSNSIITTSIIPTTIKAGYYFGIYTTNGPLYKVFNKSSNDIIYYDSNNNPFLTMKNICYYQFTSNTCTIPTPLGGNDSSFIIPNNTFLCLGLDGIINTPYIGSLSNITSNLLIVSNDSNPNNNIVSILNETIELLGGSTSNIIITQQYLNSNDIFTYNSSYDAILYWENNTSNTNNVATVLNQYYDNNKGVVLSLFEDTTFGNSFNSQLTKIITNYDSLTTAPNISYPQNSLFPILYGVNNINLGSSKFIASSFNNINNSFSIGSINNTNAINFLDDTIKGRRVDLNWYVNDAVFNDISRLETSRATLQALLWSARKI